VPGLAESDRSRVLAALLASVVAQIESESGSESESESESGVAVPHPSGIQRVIALRRAAILDLDGVPDAPGATWVESVTPPSGPDSLRRAFDDLRSRPELLLVRTPY
jgi:hypothetical protein